MKLILHLYYTESKESRAYVVSSIARKMQTDVNKSVGHILYDRMIHFTMYRQ